MSSIEEDRAERFDALTAERLDVLVVGGGIVGAGVARDAAMRGLRVGLVEQYDMAFGTSSRSSRLLHGGLRYLAQGRIGMVREASREKCILHRIAPHLSVPLPFVFPTYSKSGWPLWKLSVGVKLYDLLCGGRNLGRSSSLSREQVLDLLPGLKPKGLTGAVRYFDGLTNDARLVIDTLHSAVRAGAIVSNHTRLEDASPEPTGWQCEVTDRLTDRTRRITARSVVNATGPWGDRLSHSSIKLRPTKGVHLVVDFQRLPVCDAVVAAEGSRILFALPWGDRVILGTTDTDYSGRIEDVRTEPADVDYVLSVINGAFSTAGLSETDVIGTWAGIRPLIADRHGRPSDISRAHQINMPEPGWLDIAGGKLTTYRLIAEQAVDRLVRQLGCQADPCRTADEPLLEPRRPNPCGGVLPPPITAEVVEHCCRREWVVSLEDLMVRRTSWHYYHADSMSVARQAAGWMAPLLGWDDNRVRAELTRYLDATKAGLS